MEDQEQAAMDRTRLGPRPLPLHLAIATTTWLSSRAASPLWSSGLPPWRPEFRPQMQVLDAALRAAEPKAFAAALDGQIRQRFERLAAGIEAYRRHPYRRALAEPPVLWQDGTTRLLDYGAAGSKGPTVLVIPSLINRACILDLLPERSLLRALAACGVRPLLVDWSAPGELERGFSLTDYIAGRLERALDAAVQKVGGPVVALGYCMGGLLAVALAARRRASLAGLVCLATPWDFHAERPAQAKLIGTAATLLDPMLRQVGELPVDAIQALFTGIDPLQVVRKFVAFADMDAASPRAETFVAVEDWLNDGVPLAAPVARECLAGWYGANTPGRGEWRVAGELVQPATVDLPALVVLPDQDRIVPPASAEALAAALPRAERLQPVAGHIGMIVGGGAVEQLYRPLADWLLRLDPDHGRQGR
jgi:polyhydroxyalkanoate synthase